ncbi:Hypothetical protein D9617_11g008360 [Elsinoe fawcettii]|nr:Hypothetical protein D9617_11g008360 [Elsinoe fawcettii]
MRFDFILATTAVAALFLPGVLAVCKVPGNTCVGGNKGAFRCNCNDHRVRA